MDALRRPYSRRQFLQITAGVSAGAVAAACQAGASPTPGATTPGPSATASVAPGTPTPAPTGTFNWMTWGDHFLDEQLDEIRKTANIGANVTEFADNAEAFAKLKEVKGQLDMVSADALWVPEYFDEGLIDAFDINSLEVAKQLYSIAREFEIWTKPEGYLGYPFGWSPILIAYNPKYVSPAPDSWQALLDPKYKGKIVTENQPVEVVAYMAKAAGIADPYNMSDSELAQAKELLIQLKPNILRFAQQSADSVKALASEEAWIATSNVGFEERVLDNGGPQVINIVPKEGTVGYMDAEMIVKEGRNKPLVMPFLELAEQAEYLAQNFLVQARPLFNEQTYKILVDMGLQERVDKYLFNKPETVLTMTLKGPGSSTQGAINTFNEVFGA